MNSMLKAVGEGPGFGPPRVRPKMSPFVERLLGDRRFLDSAIESLGSPLNLVFPEQLRENLSTFHRAYERQSVSGKVFFTTKPNKSRSLVRAASMLDTMVDVSSAATLTAALGAGIAPERIEATGPKSIEYLSQAVQLGITITVDNIPELDTLMTIRRVAGISAPTPIMVRITDFKSDRVRFTRQDSPFGIRVCEISEALNRIVTHRAELRFIGFAYHLDGAGDDERVVAFENTLSLTLEAIERGLAPAAVSIGGGFRINFVKDDCEWHYFLDCLKRSVVEGGESQSWGGSGMGYRVENGMLVGSPQFMDHHVKRPGALDLEQFLSRPLPSFGGVTAARMLSELLLDLYVAPGRALLDQAGITVARVNHVKRSTFGELIVSLEMNQSNLRTMHQKLLTDPIVIPRNGAEREPLSEGIFYVGNLCIANDIIQYRKTFPGFLPKPGDSVVFVNTAAYLMDFLEAEILGQPVAKKVAVVEGRNGFTWYDDCTYDPVRIRLENTL